MSARNNPVKPPFSSSLARSDQYDKSRRLSLALSFGFRHCPKDKCPTVNMSNPFNRSCFFDLSSGFAIDGIFEIVERCSSYTKFMDLA